MGQLALKLFSLVKTQHSQDVLFYHRLIALSGQRDLNTDVAATMSGWPCPSLSHSHN